MRFELQSAGDSPYTARELLRSPGSFAAGSRASRAMISPVAMSAPPDDCGMPSPLDNYSPLCRLDTMPKTHTFPETLFAKLSRTLHAGSDAE